MKYSLSSHSLIIPLLENRFLFYQAKLKQGLLADTQSLLTLHQYLNKQPLHKTEIKYQDVSEFSLKSCLLDNPSGLKDCNKVE
mgnify:CR=1 FL=1